PPRQHTHTTPPGSCPPHLSRLAPNTIRLPPSTRPLDSHPGPTHTGTQPPQLQPRHVQRPLPIQRRNRPHPHLLHHRNNSPDSMPGTDLFKGSFFGNVARIAWGWGPLWTIPFK